MRKLTLAGAALALSAIPALAEIEIRDAYARSASPAAKSGAAFLVIENTGDTDDRLIGAMSDAAELVELHTHSEDETGMMRMRPVEEGFAIPAGSRHVLSRGGDHVMFMGLTEGWEDGDTVRVTLTFENAGERVVEIPVDTTRAPEHDMHADHSDHGAHGDHGDHGAHGDHSH